MAEKKRESWFFTKSIFDVVNELPDEVLGNELSKLQETNQSLLEESAHLRQQVTALQRENKTLRKASKEAELTDLQKAFDKVTREKEQELAVSKKQFSEYQEETNEKISILAEENRRLQETLTRVQEESAIVPDPNFIELKKEYTTLQTQLKESQQKEQGVSKQLIDSENRYHALVETDEQLKKQYNEVLTKQEALLEQIAPQIQTLEEQTMALTEQEQLIGQLNEEKEALNAALYQSYEELEKAKEQRLRSEKQAEKWQNLFSEKETDLEEAKRLLGNRVTMGNETEELIQTKQQIQELIEINKELKKEANQSQQEIGEVLISAKKQATRTVEEAQIEAKQLIHSAELTLETISNRARKIALEVDESRQNVMEIYDDLQFKVEQLAKGGIGVEIEDTK